MKTELTLEQKKERIKNFRPLDDVFFEALADDKDFCQEILRVIMEDEKLVVIDVVVQSSKRNLYGRSIRLDALCTLGNGQKCNIEVQRSDKDDHFRRVRFSASVITARDSNPGEHFKDIEDICMVYISEFDILGKGRTIYHVDSVVRETGQVVDDGLRRIFVNTVCDDGTEISELMSCFTEKEVDNPKFPVFTRRMRELKHEEGGVQHMCEIMEKYMMESREEGGTQKIITLVVKKLRKNKPLAVIADELEEEPEVIAKICHAAEACAPDYDVDEIYNRLTAQQ